MPYAKISELPPNVRNPLPVEAQRVWAAVFNDVYARNAKMDAARRDRIARQTAWRALQQQGWKKPASGDGQWVKKDLTIVQLDADDLDDDLGKAYRSFAYESRTIQRNRRSSDAQGPHQFKAATWMTRDARKRCLLCGCAEPSGGICNGVMAPTVKAADQYNPADNIGAIYKSAVIKQAEERRYTFSVLYPASPKGFDEPVLDAHNEFATPDELFDAKLGYLEYGDRHIYKQHGMIPGIGMRVTGEWVDLAQWPYEQTADFKLPSGDTVKRTIPADSIYLGVVWTPEEWPRVKSGEVSGYSLGGSAQRNEAA